MNDRYPDIEEVHFYFRLCHSDWALPSCVLCVSGVCHLGKKKPNKTKKVKVQNLQSVKIEAKKQNAAPTCPQVCTHACIKTKIVCAIALVYISLININDHAELQAKARGYGAHQDMETELPGDRCFSISWKKPKIEGTLSHFLRERVQGKLLSELFDLKQNVGNKKFPNNLKKMLWGKWHVMIELQKLLRSFFF